MDSSNGAQVQLFMYLVYSYRRHAVVNRQTESDSQTSGKGSRAAETNRQTGAAAGAAGMTEAVSTHDDEQLEVMTSWFYAFICFSFLLFYSKAFIEFMYFLMHQGYEYDAGYYTSFCLELLYAPKSSSFFG